MSRKKPLLSSGLTAFFTDDLHITRLFYFIFLDLEEKYLLKTTVINNLFPGL